MDPANFLPALLGIAVLLPLFSFFVILLLGPKMGEAGKGAGYFATAAIGTSSLLSFVCLFGLWLPNHWPAAGHHGDEHHGDSHAQLEAAQFDPLAIVIRGQEPAASESHAEEKHASDAEQGHADDGHADDDHADDDHADDDHADDGHADEHHADGHHAEPPPAYAGEYQVPLTGSPWILGQFGDLRISIGYYIDSLTIAMFCMVTFIATLIHIYAMGYMHDELHDITDHEVTMSDGNPLHRPGRYSRFFQYLSLFCFSMLGLVVAGNILMVFIFWELVGVCSYFLIGFYVERKSASNAANKAFIVNRVGDFGMILGLMALWTGLGTFSFGDYTYENAQGDVVAQRGIFSQVRSPENDYQLQTPDGLVVLAARNDVGPIVQELGPDAAPAEVNAALASRVAGWRDGSRGSHLGYGLLILAGLGIFAGCVGKSAQFPLHVWLPDAMEGPTPVSALVHSATMVAAGVYLVARFFPVFTPEVLLVIAIVGCITLFMAATIAITATDIKRVLAYSTISQLGYMMMALGVGAWVAGVMHLITHAFFKSLLFMCSGSVIHAVHTNEMTEMGGLRKKMPVTAYTMLIGCLAIAGAGIPFIMSFFGEPLKGLGLSGFYSKDAILEQAFSFMGVNSSFLPSVFFLFAAGGAAITAFYMFRMWYLTFAGSPRDAERYDHAHESPPTMYVPLVILSVMAIAVAWLPSQGILGGLVAFIVLLALYFRNRASGGPATSHATADGHDGHDGHGVHAETEHADGNHGHEDHGHEDHGHEDHGHEDHGHEDHGHEDHGHALPPWMPKLPVTLAAGVTAVAIIWAVFASDAVLVNLLEQARPAGTLADVRGVLWDGLLWPNEHAAHESEIVIPVSMIAIGTAFAGFLLATLMYGLGRLSPQDVRRQFEPVYQFLLNKWWFDELYEIVFIRPTHKIGGWLSGVDRRVIDRLVDGLAWVTRAFSVTWDHVADRTIVDGFVNKLARWTYSTGLSLRTVQTGSLRQYVVFIVVGAVSIFILISFFWNPTLAG